MKESNTQIGEIELSSIEEDVNWRISWNKKDFRWFFWLGIVALPVTLYFFSAFLNFAEQRNGIVLDDWVLNLLPAMDLSIPIFGLIWSCILLVIWRAIKSPRIFLMYLWGFILICISRVFTIYFVPLNPPKDLIVLVDPLVNYLFYSGGWITKDLFYSGHTASTLLAYFCFQNRFLRAYALFATVAVGIMLMIQHVHYTIDILFMPVFTYGAFWLTKRSLSKVF